MSGAAFIKWGQWSSTRPDMFPVELCRALSQLHSDAPTHTPAHTRKLVQRTFGGRPIEEVFDWFDMKPIASGSIAQIHKAVLQGTVVAVKVRHPKVAEKMAMDFRIMKWLANVADNSPGLRWMNLGPSMEQFGHTMGAQTRLDVEARHLNLFNRNFKGWKKECTFPRALGCSEEVLIETFEEGFLISEYMRRYTPAQRAAATAAGRAVDEGDEFQMNKELAHFIVSRGEDMYLKMLLVDNLMHADLHPGNILLDVRSDSSRSGSSSSSSNNSSAGKSSPRLVLVDAGMVAQLVPEEQEAFIGLLQCMGAGDGAAAARYILQFAAVQPCGAAEAEAFVAAMAAHFDATCKGYDTGVDVGAVLRGSLALVRAHNVRIDVNYATLMMNVLCLDGLARDLLPEYNVLDGAKPLLRAYKTCSAGPAKLLLRAVLPLAQGVKRRRDKWIERRPHSRYKTDTTTAVVPAENPGEYAAAM